MPASEITTTPLLCNQCGASLNVAENTNFASCGYCNSKLKVHRSGGAVFSEVVEAIKERQDHTDNRVRILELENQILRLNQQWEMTKDRFMVHPKEGKPYLPDTKSGTGNVIGIIAAVVIGFVAVSMVGDIGFLFLLFAVGITVVSAISSSNKREKYLAAKSSHESQVRRLQSEISQLR